MKLKLLYCEGTNKKVMDETKSFLLEIASEKRKLTIDEEVMACSSVSVVCGILWALRKQYVPVFVIDMEEGDDDILYQERMAIRFMFRYVYNPHFLISNVRDRKSLEELEKVGRWERMNVVNYYLSCQDYVLDVARDFEICEYADDPEFGFTQMILRGKRDIEDEMDRKYVSEELDMFLGSVSKKRIWIPDYPGSGRLEKAVSRKLREAGKR